MFDLYVAYCLFLFHFLVLRRNVTLSFSGFFCQSLGFLLFVVVWSSVQETALKNHSKHRQNRGLRPTDGHIRYCLLELCFNLSLPNWSGADIGPRYSLSTLTIGNTNVLVFNLSRPKPRWVLIVHYLNHDGFYFITTHWF
jgi:hypothetical protein